MILTARRLIVIGLFATAGFAIRCGSDSSNDSGDGTSTSTTETGTTSSTGLTCSAVANTTATTTLNAYGCPLLTRDTSSCKASREAQGLSGFWLNFSCSVTLTKNGNNVTIATKSIPDSKSYYYSSTDACYEAFSSTARKANPNKIVAQNISMTVPYSPTAAASATATPEGVIGIAVNGVSIYDNSAAPGDDIYKEEATFDKCDGHPDAFSRFHYHTEPGSVTNDDAGFVGILRDGFPIYGKKEYGTNAAATGLDAQGGKTGKTVDSPNADVYHYHLNYQTNGTKSAYFISAGYYKGTEGACTGCK